MARHLKKAFFLICLFALIVNIFLLKNSANRPGQLSFIAENLNTCFSRVTQTNTARLLGFSASLHLSDNFLQKTETCFADTALLAKDGSGEFFLGLVSQINLLATDAHWYFEKTSKGPSIITKDEGNSNSGAQFLKLENEYFDILASIDLQREKDHKTYRNLKNIVHINIALVLLCVVVGIFSFFKFLTRKKTIELNAEDELSKKKEFNRKNAKEILSTALDFADLPKCQSLLEEFSKNALLAKREKQLIEEIALSQEKRLESPPELILPPTPKIEEEEVIVKNTLDVPEILAQIIEQLSIQFFAKGIKLEINIEEDLELDWDRDAFEQILCEAITRTLAINPSHIFLDFEKDKKNPVFKVSFMTRSEQNKEIIKSHFELTSSFMKEFGGTISFIEIEKFHFSVNLNFSASFEFLKKKTKNKKELVRFKKASKRELQAQLLN